jgi:hypothetical protein
MILLHDESPGFCQALPEGRILVALADVTGHGIGPALLAAACRAYSRVTFGQHNGFLKSMEQVNTAIAKNVGEGRFVSFVDAIIGAGKLSGGASLRWPRSSFSLLAETRSL